MNKKIICGLLLCLSNVAYPITLPSSQQVKTFIHVFEAICVSALAMIKTARCLQYIKPLIVQAPKAIINSVSRHKYISAAATAIAAGALLVYPRTRRPIVQAGRTF